MSGDGDWACAAKCADHDDCSWTCDRRVGHRGHHAGSTLPGDPLHPSDATATLTAQRDAARDIAARLEGECARLEAALREVATVLGEYGEANHPAQLCALMALGEWDPDAVTAEGES